MSLQAEQEPGTGLDHIRDTLTGMVSFASKTRGEMHQRFDKQDKRMDRLEQKVDKQGSDITELKADNAEIKEMLKTLLSR